MKKIVKKPVVVQEESVVVESDEQEFLSLLGKEICIFGAIYIYAGVLVGVNGTHIVLENGQVVYETGSFSSSSWKDAQKLPCKELKVRKEMIESYFEVVR